MMGFDPDLALVVGMVLFLLSLLSLAAAWADTRRPVLGALVCALGIALVMTAFMVKPAGYALGDLGMVVFDVLGRYVL